MSPKIWLIISAVMLGFIGVISQGSPFEPEMISLSRSAIGGLFVFAFCFFTKRKMNMGQVKKNAGLLILSGAAFGICWVFLFEAYVLIDVSTAIVCFYLAPVIVTAVSPFILKEKLSIGSAACVLTALLGLILVTGIGTEMTEYSILGVIYAVAAAVFYAAIIIINKKIVGLGGIERTVFQLAASAAVMLPYVFIVGAFPQSGVPHISLFDVFILLFLSTVLTGVVYLIFFSVVDKVKTQTISVILYLDPITAVILSSLILSERMTLIQIFGAILILGATFVNEVVLTKFKKTEESI